jgi:hypothetical protein
MLMVVASVAAWRGAQPWNILHPDYFSRIVDVGVVSAHCCNLQISLASSKLFSVLDRELMILT